MPYTKDYIQKKLKEKLDASYVVSIKLIKNFTYNCRRYTFAAAILVFCL